jgi:3',5'-cyclic AMP phosphodiesterase CpdA
LRVRDGVAVIGLNSAVVTPPFMATGRLGRAQRERFAGLLRRTGEQGLFRLVLLHHPPRVKDEKWRKRLVDGDALCRILGDEGAELVLHGHGHHSAEGAIPFAGGAIPVFGIPSASALGRRPGRCARYYLYRVRRGERNWSVQIRIRGYQPATGTFTALDERYLSLPVMASTSC